jgi:hypothetical protein
LRLHGGCRRCCRLLRRLCRGSCAARHSRRHPAGYGEAVDTAGQRVGGGAALGSEAGAADAAPPPPQALLAGIDAPAGGVARACATAGSNAQAASGEPVRPHAPPPAPQLAAGSAASAAVHCTHVVAGVLSRSRKRALRHDGRRPCKEEERWGVGVPLVPTRRRPCLRSTAAQPARRPRAPRCAPPPTAAIERTWFTVIEHAVIAAAPGGAARSRAQPGLAQQKQQAEAGGRAARH